MTIYLSTSLLRDNVVQPLNEKYNLYFSLLCNGSCATKINGKKGLYIIKTCNQGTPKSDVLSLQEPEDIITEGLHESLKKVITNAKLSFPRKEQMVGVGSDSANANRRLFALEKAAVGDHLAFSWGLSHKLELALQDAFKDISLESSARNLLQEEFYIFNEATLKWHLFKQYAEIVGQTAYR